jgi:hypothetical protein
LPHPLLRCLIAPAAERPEHERGHVHDIQTNEDTFRTSRKMLAAIGTALPYARAMMSSFALLDELLAAVDVVCRARDRGIDHQVNGECGDVGRSDHPADGERRAELFAPGFESVAKQRGRQRGIDESGGDDV